MANISDKLKEELRAKMDVFINTPIEDYFSLFRRLHRFYFRISYDYFATFLYGIDIFAAKLNLNDQQKKELYDFELKHLILREKQLFDIGFAKLSENLVREGAQITNGKENVKVVSNRTGKELTKGTGDILFMSVSAMFWDMTNRLAWHSKESIEKGDQPWAIKYYTMQIVAGFTTIESFINSCAKDYIDGLNLEKEDDTPKIFGDEFKINRDNIY